MQIEERIPANQKVARELDKKLYSRARTQNRPDRRAVQARARGNSAMEFVLYIYKSESVCHGFVAMQRGRRAQLAGAERGADELKSRSKTCAPRMN